MRTSAIRTLRRLQSTSTTPAITDVPKLWNTLPHDQRTTVSQSLDAKMTAPWTTLSLDEKRAAYYIAFGPHGPRAPPPEHANRTILLGSLGVVAVSGVLLWAFRVGGQETPHTMTKEWQEKTNELMRAQKTNPMTGITSEGYSGPGFVQSK